VCPAHGEADVTLLDEQETAMTNMKASAVKARMSKPLHPLLVHFPIALLVTAFVADVCFVLTAMDSLRDAGWWMLFAAAVSGVGTVLAGIFDMRRAQLDEEVHPRVHRHMWVGIALSLLIVLLAAWRWVFFSDPSTPLSSIYLDAAFLVVALAGFQGWLGGELVYTHGVFVRQQKGGDESHEGQGPANAKAAGSGHEHSY
jgi:uncharacterized membrane protein